MLYGKVRAIAAGTEAWAITAVGYREGILALMAEIDGEVRLIIRTRDLERNFCTGSMP